MGAFINALKTLKLTKDQTTFLFRSQICHDLVISTADRSSKLAYLKLLLLAARLAVPK
jgi:hypothetical protein